MLSVGEFTDTFIPVVDGVGRVVLAYAETLCKMGHRVTVSSPLYDTGYRGGYPFDLIDYNASKMILPGTRQYNSGASGMDKHYQRRMDHTVMDIAHAHSPFNAGKEALRVARERDIPLVATFHSKFYDDFYKATKSETISQLGVKYVLDFFNRCDEVWAVSEASAKVLVEYGYTKQEIYVVPNGVTLRRAEPDAIKAVNAQFGLGNDPVLLFVGQINWKKNILRVLEACALLKQQGNLFHLVLAGQGPDEKEIRKKARELFIDDRLIMTGHLTDTKLLDGLYERASLFVFPSIYDNAPMVVREAAVMGTPSVLVRGSSASEIVQDHENGLLCDNDSENLCSVLADALKDPECIRRMGEKARETIPVPWEKVMEQVVGRYEYLIDLGKRGKLDKKSWKMI